MMHIRRLYTSRTFVLFTEPSMSWPWAPPPQDGRPSLPPPNFAAPPPPNFLVTPNLHTPSPYNMSAQHQFVSNYANFPQQQMPVTYAQYPPFAHAQNAAYLPVYAPMQPHPNAQMPLHHQFAQQQRSPAAWAPTHGHAQSNGHAQSHAGVALGPKMQRVPGQHVQEGVNKRPYAGGNAREERRGRGAAGSGRNSNGGANGGGGGATRGVERELAQARAVLASLGKTLPGDDADEVARYVAERKRKWPRTSRQPVPSEGDALAQIAEGYADASSGSEGDKPAPSTHTANQRGRQKRAGNNGPRPVRGPPRKRSRPVLLNELLRSDINKERHVLLQAIGHLLRKKEAAPSD